MTEMTKEQRNKIYKEALKFFIENPVVTGMCYCIDEVREHMSFETIDPYDENIHHYPEIARYKPKSHGMFWFPNTKEHWLSNRNKRIQIFKEAIILTNTYADDTIN